MLRRLCGVEEEAKETKTHRTYDHKNKPKRKRKIRKKNITKKEQFQEYFTRFVVVSCVASCFFL